jgi:PHD/YefM family antitoxin component YafN of YafNO toxin-antitoxin module
MKEYTYSEALQDLLTVLDTARKDGAVRIRQGDGQSFILTPESPYSIPTKMKNLNLGLTNDEIVSIVREGRERFG